MENIYDRALTALQNRTLDRNQWLNIYGAYRCALKAYRGSNISESLMAEGLMTHDLGIMLSNMMAAPKRTYRRTRISHKSLSIRHKLRRAATH